MGVNIETIFDLAFQDDLDNCAIKPSKDYFENELKRAANVQKTTEALENIGVQVKTEYGNYRSLYDVLADIGERYDQMKF